MTEQSEGERLYILGHPVAHSKSPVMYNALYERLGLPWTYALPISPSWTTPAHSWMRESSCP